MAEGARVLDVEPFSQADRVEHMGAVGAFRMLHVLIRIKSKSQSFELKYHQQQTKFH